jgi:Ricin-type beta-trefoil lectin domain
MMNADTPMPISGRVLLATLLLVLVFFAPGHASAGTAEEVSLLPTLDPLNRTESPLSFSGKWTRMTAWATTAGNDTTSGWKSSTELPSASGAYWNPNTFDDKKGDAVAVTMPAGVNVSQHYGALWLDAPTPGTAKTGYQLRWRLNAGGTSYTETIAKWSAGTETVLSTNASATIAAGTTIAFSDTGGTLTAWHGTTTSLTSALTATDASYSSGYAGIESSGIGSLLFTNFKAGMLLGGALAGTPVLDDFGRQEVPLATGKWTKPTWAASLGGSYAGGYHGYGGGSGINGAYWNPTSFTSGKDGLAVAATVGTGSTTSGQYEAVWLNMPSPGTARSGYEARFTGTGTANVYKAELAEWASGSRSVLASKDNVSLPVNTSFALSKSEDSLVLWTGTSAFNPLLSARDTTFAGGYAGIEVNGGQGTLYNFRAGAITVDSQAPDTTINTGPTGAVAPAAVSFTFSSTELGSSFECSLDGGAYAACASPKSYPTIQSGSHSFRVKASDPAGNPDPTPAERTFEVVTPPSATTNAATGVKSTGATLNASVNPNGLATTFQFEYGLTTSYGNTAPAAAKSAGSGSSAVAVAEPISGLAPGTTYHVRVSATNSAGTVKGVDKTFTTTAAPQVATGTATQITAKEATLEATVNPRGAATTYYFEYGLTTSYGTKVPLTPKDAGSGSSPVNVVEALSGLAEGSKYHYRIVGVNEVGTAYGTDQALETPLLPDATTDAAIGVNGSEAVLKGHIDANGETTEFSYEYGTTGALGSRIKSEEEAVGTIPTGTEEALVELDPNTTYYYRLRADSRAGTDLGPTKSFTTAAASSSSTVIPADFYGVQWGHPHDMHETKGANMAQRSGAKYLRVDILNNDFDWEQFDTLFYLAAKRGIKILPHLGAGVIPKKENGDRQKWIEKVKEAVGRYGHNGSFWNLHSDLAQYTPTWWEIWNEPNWYENGWLQSDGNGNEQKVVRPDIYGELLQEASDAVKGLDSQAQILAGSLLSVGPDTTSERMLVSEFISGMGHGSAYDALSVHPYAFRDNDGNIPGDNWSEAAKARYVEEVAKKVLGNIRKAREALKGVGLSNRPIWITEIGWPVPGTNYGGDGDKGKHPPIPQLIQRDLINDTFRRIEEKAGNGADDLNIDRVIYYNLQDYNDDHWDHHTGLVSDYNKQTGKARFRPAWYAFQEWSGFQGTWPRKPGATHRHKEARPQRLLEDATVNGYGRPVRYWIKWGEGPSSSTYGNFTSAVLLDELDEQDIDVQAVIPAQQPGVPGLQSGHTYHYRLVVENDAETDDSGNAQKAETEDLQFTTPPSAVTSISKDQVLHGQPGWAWLSGWVKEGSEDPNGGPGIPSGYVKINFKRSENEPGEPIISVQANVTQGKFASGWVPNLGWGEWYYRVVFPAQNGWDEAVSSWHHDVFIHDGVQVIAKHSQKCMDINGVQTQNGAGVMHGQCLNPQTSQNQVFTTEPFGEFFRLRARHSGRCVDVTNASTSDGAAIQQYDCHTGGNQLFRQVWWGETPYADYRAQHSGKCLDVTGANTGWTQIQQWTCNGNEQQRFRLEPVDSAPIPTETFWTLDQALHGSPGLVSFHGRLQAGAYPMSGRIVHVEIDNADTPNWDTSGGDITFGIDGNNYYEFRDWRLDPGHWNVRARFAGNGEFAGSTSSTQGITIKRGYLIRGRQSGRCLSLSENKNQNGQAFIIWDCSAVNGNGQVFSFVARGGNWYDMRPNGTNRCLDVAGAGTGDGTNLQLWDCLGDGQPNQHWKREPISGQAGWYALIPRHAQNKCADVKEQKTNNGQRVWQWGCTWNGNQQWDLEGVIEP